MIVAFLLTFLSIVVYGYGSRNDDFRLGIQLCDHKPGANAGAVRYTPYVSSGGGWSVWAGDSNYYDPDGMRIGIFGPSPGRRFRIKDRDIRLCIQLTDHAKNSKGNSKYNGRPQCTPWASRGGGWSKFAGDSNFYDYDAVRVKLETRRKKGLIITNVRAGVRLTDNGRDKRKRGPPRFTKWFAQAKNTWSQWAGDSNFYDADSIQIYLDAKGPAIRNDVDGGYDFVINTNQYHLFIFLIGLIGVLIAFNIICCYVNNNRKNKGYKIVSYDTNTDDEKDQQ